MIVGHSTEQWQEWHDCKFHPRLGQNAVNAMHMWRNASGQPAATISDDLPQRQTLAPPFCSTSSGSGSGGLQAEFEGVMSKYLSCSFGKDDKIELVL